MLRLQPGFVDFIDYLRDKQVRMAVHTNRRLEGIQTVLDILACPPILILWSQLIRQRRPSPEGALRICATWQTPPETVLFVGDSEHDKETAQGAGVVLPHLTAALCGDG